MNIFEETDVANVQSEDEVGAVDVRFEQDMRYIELNDGRQIGLPFRKIKWLGWLANATPDQRAKWTIEPRGYAVWWDELDDGVEVVHALSTKPLPLLQEYPKQADAFVYS